MSKPTRIYRGSSPFDEFLLIFIKIILLQKLRSEIRDIRPVILGVAITDLLMAG